MKKTMLLLLLTLPLHAEQNLSELLNLYAKNSDLSEKTRLENSGTVTLFSRRDIEMMQARNLRDLLKSAPTVGYNESRYGLVDSMYSNSFQPFSSSRIRLFVDDQEITSGTTSSGLIIMGNVDLGFVDHVEVYTFSPTFEYASESAHILIRLYSKTAQRDLGGKLEAGYGSRGFNYQNASYAEESENLSYFACLSHLDDRRAVYGAPESPLKRDLERYMAFAKLTASSHTLSLTAIQHDQDPFINTSLDATPDKDASSFGYDYLMLGYSGAFDDIKITLAGEKALSSAHYRDNLALKNTFLHALYSEFEDVTDAYTASLDIKYSHTLDRHNLVAGGKLQFRYFDRQLRKSNGHDETSSAFDRQAVRTLYLEDRLDVGSADAINLGLRYSNVRSNGRMPSMDLWSLRAGYTHVENHWAFNTFLHRTQFGLDTIIGIIFPDLQTETGFRPETTNSITQEIKYSDRVHEVKALMSYVIIEDFIRGDGTGNFTNYDDYVLLMNPHLSYMLHLDVNHKVAAGVTFTRMDDVPTTGQITFYDAYVRTLNRLGPLDWFAELVYCHNYYNENGYDLSLGAKYSVSDAFRFSLKGENVLNAAEKSDYPRVFITPPTFEPTLGESLKIAPVEQRVYGSIEYLF